MMTKVESACRRGNIASMSLPKFGPRLFDIQTRTLDTAIKAGFYMEFCAWVLIFNEILTVIPSFETIVLIKRELVSLF